MVDVKSERRWMVRQLIIATNLLVLGVAFYADYNGLVLNSFVWSASGFQGASAVWFAADYATKPKE